jgi:hypothetical protein
MPVISGPEELAAFRNRWDGRRMLDLLQQNNGRLRVDWAVGVGKSCNIDRIIEEAVLSTQYDLVIALSPTRRVIEERTWVTDPPPGIRIVNLKPRPHRTCGVDLNRQWRIFEKKALGALGRKELCGRCPSEPGCPWPRQFGKSLKGTQVIFGAQAHLERSPYFLDQLVQWTGAKRVLVILDEANFIMKSYKRRIDREQLQTFVDVLCKLDPKRWGKTLAKWKYLCDLLLRAPTNDLRSPDWKMPWVYHEWSLAVQSCGYSIYGDSFCFLAFDLFHFGRSPLESRERAANGDLLFAAVPSVSMDFIIYSGTAHHRFSHYRLGWDFVSPFEEHRFEHPDTTWYNIASRLGVKKYFGKNAAQILDFFAELVARRLREGKRPLLVAKKCFVDFCAQQMQERLQAAGLDVKVVIDGWTAELLGDDRVVPVINYGVIGINLFESFDCAYCLTGYYVTEDAVNNSLQDILASDMKVPLSILIEGRPCRRRAGVLNAKDQIYDVHQMAQHALDCQEMDTVLQAVGRVRPYTRPREIITFQCAGHPDLTYTSEFFSIGEARKYFGIRNRRSKVVDEVRSGVQQMKTQGLRQREAAQQLGVSLRTIKRYW